MLASETTVSLSFLIDMLSGTDTPQIVSEYVPPTDDAFGQRTFFRDALGRNTLKPPAIFGPKTSPEGLTSSAPREVSTSDTTVNRARKYSIPQWTMEPWLEENLEAIAAYRDTQFWANHYHTVPSHAALDVAEMIALSFTSVPASLRPQFVVDTEGQPSFTLYNDHLYLHLSIDENGFVSWYSVAGDREDSDDDVELTAETVTETTNRIVSLAA